ncbi:MAG: toprim domain-containing protein, partial [Desulfovibrionaceae bacterium]|nr:toprim domain-containing protein [Desulfovibrionaceae bacterium]
MSKDLIIVESPAKVKTIGKFLGRDFKVAASVGHVRDLPVSDLGVDEDQGFAPRYEVIKGKEG